MLSEYPGLNHLDPMTSRAPASAEEHESKQQAGPRTPVSETEIDSPWRRNIRGSAGTPPEEGEQK